MLRQLLLKLCKMFLKSTPHLRYLIAARRARLLIVRPCCQAAASNEPALNRTFITMSRQSTQHSDTDI